MKPEKNGGSACKKMPVISCLTLLVINILVSLKIPGTQSNRPILPITMLVSVSVCTYYKKLTGSQGEKSVISF
jgi:hypothetical protein